MRQLFKPLWFRWKSGVFAILGCVTWLASLAAYLLGVGPVALGMRLRGKDLLERDAGDAGPARSWRELRRSSRAASDLDLSRRPF